MKNSYFISFIFSFILTFLCLLVLIPLLRKIKLGQIVRLDGPSTHLKKQGTPTMGGLAIIFGVVISFINNSMIYLNLNLYHIFKFIFPLILYLFIGLLDDYLIVKNSNNIGVKPLLKIVLQLFGVMTYYFIFLRNNNTVIDLVFFKIDFKHFYFVLIILIYVSTVNAVNISDGLDGLSTGLLITSFIGIAIVSYFYKNNYVFIFSLTMLGALLAFLIFNANPAKIFMGNTGSLMLGSALATAVILLEEEMLLLVIAFIFVIETLSVIIQVVYYKLSNGKRVFLMAPLHHHYEKKGFNEWQIDLIFWIVNLLAIMILLIIILA